MLFFTEYLLWRVFLLMVSLQSVIIFYIFLMRVLQTLYFLQTGPSLYAQYLFIFYCQCIFYIWYLLLTVSFTEIIFHRLSCQYLLQMVIFIKRIFYGLSLTCTDCWQLCVIPSPHLCPLSPR